MPETRKTVKSARSLLLNGSKAGACHVSVMFLYALKAKAIHVELGMLDKLLVLTKGVAWNYSQVLTASLYITVY